jgi:hypothetical protein
VDRHAVLDGKVPMPASARNLVHELRAYPGTAIGI